MFITIPKLDCQNRDSVLSWNVLILLGECDSRLVGSSPYFTLDEMRMAKVLFCLGNKDG